MQPINAIFSIYLYLRPSATNRTTNENNIQPIVAINPSKTTGCVMSQPLMQTDLTDSIINVVGIQRHN